MIVACLHLLFGPSATIQSEDYSVADPKKNNTDPDTDHTTEGPKLTNNKNIKKTTLQPRSLDPNPDSIFHSDPAK